MSFHAVIGTILLLALPVLLFVALTKGIPSRAHGWITSDSSPLRFWTVLTLFMAWLATAGALLWDDDSRGFAMLGLLAMVVVVNLLAPLITAMMQPGARTTVAGILADRAGRTIASMFLSLLAGLLVMIAMMFFWYLVIATGHFI